VINTGDLLGAVQGVDGTDTLGQVNVVRQGASQIRQQGVKGPESVCGDSINNPIEVPVAVAVEANLLGSLLHTQSLQGPDPIQSAMGAVCWTRHPVHPGTGPAVPLTFVPLVEMLHLHFATETHEYGCTVWETKRGGKCCGEKFSLAKK